VAPGSGHTVWLPLPESAVGAFVARYVNPPEAVAPYPSPLPEGEGAEQAAAGDATGAKV